MCRTKLCIGPYPSKVRGQIFRFVEHLLNDPVFDRVVDRFLLSTTEEDVRQCYGPELGVMLAKLSAQTKVVEKMLNGIVNGIDDGKRVMQAREVLVVN